MSPSKILIILYVISTAGGLILLKLGSTGGAVVELINGKLTSNLTLLNTTGILLYGLSFLLYLYLIAKNDLGYIIPLTTGLVYILVFIASVIVFRESFTLIKALAIILIVAGVILITNK